MGRARAIGVAAGLLLVVAVAAVVTTLLNHDDSPRGNPAAQSDRTTTRTTTTTDEPAPETTTPKVTTTTPTPPANTNTQQPQPPPQGGSGATPAQTIEEYYTLVPGNLDQAWGHLSPRFQSGHAGGRTAFANWWGKVNSVSVSGVSEAAGGIVDATVLYNFKDGHSQQEQTQFRLVNVNGAWLIDSQTVISSRTV